MQVLKCYVFSSQQLTATEIKRIMANRSRMIMALIIIMCDDYNKQNIINNNNNYNNNHNNDNDIRCVELLLRSCCAALQIQTRSSNDDSRVV